MHPLFPILIAFFNAAPNVNFLTPPQIKPLINECVTKSSFWTDIPRASDASIHINGRTVDIKFSIIVPPTMSERLDDFDQHAPVYVQLDSQPTFYWDPHVALRKAAAQKLSVWLSQLSIGKHVLRFGIARDKGGFLDSYFQGCFSVPSITEKKTFPYNNVNR